MAVASAQVVVADTATALSATATDHVSGSALAVSVPSDAAASVFIGASGVTTSTGYELAAGDKIALDLEEGESLYGIVASGPVTVHVLRSGV